MLTWIKTQSVLICFYLLFLLHVVKLLKHETEVKRKVAYTKEISHAFREQTELLFVVVVFNTLLILPSQKEGKEKNGDTSFCKDQFA